MSVFFVFRKCLFACFAILISVVGQVHAELPEPIPPEQGYDWTRNTTWINSAYALGVSHWNILKYYKEAEHRYGTLPPADQLRNAIVGWDIYLSSNIPGLNKHVKKNNPPNHGGGWSIATPEIPLVNREVTPVNKSEGFRNPMMPPLRLTRDGRIGVVPASGGLDGDPQPMRIMLNRPEALDKHFLESAPGLPATDPEPFVVSDHGKWGLPGSKTTHFVSICEGEASSVSEKNPYTCGAGGRDDCYNFTLIGSAVEETFSTSDIYGLEGGYRTKYMPQLKSGDRLYSREVTVRVSKPKTPQAKIVSVEFSDDYEKAPIRQGVLFELNTPADGRLLVTRRQGLPLIWRDSNTGEMRAGSYETVYAVAPEDSEPCDVTQWGDLKPISHAPFDPSVSNRYDFAKYPFRDPMGNPIPDGKDMKATYPWVDRDAKNLSLMISDANLFKGGLIGGASRFPAHCVHAGCTPSDSQDKSNISQFTVMGAWTKGKMVIFDNRVNYSDFRINLADAVYLDLYEPGSALPATVNKSASVEVGAYREVGGGTIKDEYIALEGDYGIPLRDASGEKQTYLMKNSSLFDSIENRMNYNPHMKPIQPHDTVWLLSSGATTDEFSFDDLLNDNAFIISDMVAAYKWPNDSRFRMTGFDGWNETYGTWQGQVKVQNAATTLGDQWIVPQAGDVVHGRIEPVGNGGIKGKGIYFNGENTRIKYDIPSDQPKSLEASDWFHSLFLDARNLSSGAEQVIIDFPDKSRLTMAEADSNISLHAYNNYGERQHTVKLPKTMVAQHWFHLGIERAENGRITLYVNGYPYEEFPASDGSLFRMKSGSIVLGRDHHNYDRRYANWWHRFIRKSTATPTNYRVFKGWMDEYKVFSYQPDPESACNIAHGTLVATGSNTKVNERASLYSSAMHNRISTALELRGQPVHSRYACYMGTPEQDSTALLHRLPVGSVSVRTNMHFPEGPLYHDAPRPDSTTNEFCLSCHSSGSKIDGLSFEALQYRNIPAKYDPRRQPKQTPPHITGNISREFLNSIDGNWSALGSSLIDEYVLPDSSGVSPDIRNLVLIRDGEPIEALTTGESLVKESSSTLRANVNGLTSRAVFRVNGVTRKDDRSAPFELPLDELFDGSNKIEVITYSPNGKQSRRSFSITADAPSSSSSTPPWLGWFR